MHKKTNRLVIRLLLGIILCILAIMVLFGKLSLVKLGLVSYIVSIWSLDELILSRIKPTDSDSQYQHHAPQYPFSDHRKDKIKGA